MSNQLIQFIFNCFQSFVLGIIQGFTEFLPISSTAHLKIVPHFIGWSDPGVSISASLQLGSALAVVFYFRSEVSKIINSFFVIFRKHKLFIDENTTLATYILVATLPILLLGLIVKFLWVDYSNSYFRSLEFIAYVSIIMSIFLGLSEFYGRRIKTFNDINIKDIFFIGISQCFAIFPGVSRSGITLTSALFSGIERETAAKMSFLIGIPAILLSGTVEFFSLFHKSLNLDVLPILIGITASFLSSILAINFFLKFIAKNNTFVFVYYRLAFGIFILSTL